MLSDSSLDLRFKNSFAVAYRGPQFGYRGLVVSCTHRFKRSHNLRLGIEFDSAVTATDASVGLNGVVHHQVLAEVGSCLDQRVRAFGPPQTSSA